jgi:hypothetical protein
MPNPNVPADILTHPVTIVLLGAFLTTFGYLLKWFRDLDRQTGYNTKAIDGINETQKRITLILERHDDRITEIHEKLSNLQTKHDMIERSGNLLASHEKKTV